MWIILYKIMNYYEQQTKNMKPTTTNLFRAKKAVDSLNSKPHNKLLSALLWAGITTMALFIIVQLFAKYY